MPKKKAVTISRVAQQIPVLPLRDIVVYPNVVVPLFVGRVRSINSINMAMEHGKQILVVTQRNADVDDPASKDLYKIGTVCIVLQLLKLPDGTIKILLEGEKRVKIANFYFDSSAIIAEVVDVEEKGSNVAGIESLMRSAVSLFHQYVKLNQKIPSEILNIISSIEEPGRLSDIITAHLTSKIDSRQEILSCFNIKKRLKLVIALLGEGIDILQTDKRVTSRVRKQMEKTQREYYLHEQIKAIQKELGTDKVADEHATFLDRIKKSGMSKEAKEKAEAELNKLKLMPPMSAEASVSRNYLDCLLKVPWKKRSRVNKNLNQAESILNNEHYGLKKVKERILEYLAVQTRVKKLKGPILCLVGPPGVGKTSFGKSIAHATNREFVRMSLGGVRDEAEIRGHRRTYIGSLPGKIIHHLMKVGVKNPLFLLDEVDKMSMDFRGDPASALLEALDPEQNHSFNDHYLEVDYDLSEVMFVTTANSLDLPPALLDRMEVIELSGYTEHEKINIVKNHMIEKQFKANGIDEGELSISDETIRDIIRYYTREAGVRNLERSIAKICRKIVKEILLIKQNKKKKKKYTIKPKDLEKYLGVRIYNFGKAEESDQIGQVTGLAWTEAGGELLTVEATTMLGKGEVMRTGQLGEVMQESIQAAMSVVRSRARSLGINNEFFEKHDIHIHVPEGAIPKDGPSAGITMCIAIVSILAKIPVCAHVAMTGEITLRGEVLPIGGLKEKLLAALRGGIRVVIIPEENRKDLKEIPKEILNNIEIHPVRWIEQVLQLALTNMPEPLPAEAEKKPSSDILESTPLVRKRKKNNKEKTTH